MIRAESSERDLTPDQLREALTVDGAVSVRALLACAFPDSSLADREYAAGLVNKWRATSGHTGPS